MIYILIHDIQKINLGTNKGEHMGLLENESWDDYINKEVYVTHDDGQTGFKGTVKDYNEVFVMVEDDEGEQFEIEHPYVFGTWVLEDW